MYMAKQKEKLRLVEPRGFDLDHPEPEPPSSITNSSGSNNNNPPTSRAERADAAKPTYTSPSDTIMSPTSKKLSQIKGRRFATAKPPQPMLLVAKTATTAGG